MVCVILVVTFVCCALVYTSGIGVMGRRKRNGRSGFGGRTSMAVTSMGVDVISSFGPVPSGARIVCDILYVGDYVGFGLRWRRTLGA